MSDQEVPMVSAGATAHRTMPDNGGHAIGAPGPAAPTARQWEGARSGVLFSARPEEGHVVFGVRVETEIPLVMREMMRDSEALDSFADLIDLGFAVSRDGAAGPETAREVRENALGLAQASQYLRHIHATAMETLEAQRAGMEKSGANLAAQARHERSVSLLGRVADRLDATLSCALGADMHARIRAEPPTTTSH